MHQIIQNELSVIPFKIECHYYGFLLLQDLGNDYRVHRWVGDYSAYRRDELQSGGVNTVLLSTFDIKINVQV